MLRVAIKARLAVQVGYLYKRRNAERSSEHLTRRARQRRARVYFFQQAASKAAAASRRVALATRTACRQLLPRP